VTATALSEIRSRSGAGSGRLDRDKSVNSLTKTL